MPKDFVCLKCPSMSYFASYKDLSEHKVLVHTAGSVTTSSLTSSSSRTAPVVQPGFRHPSTRFSLVNRDQDFCDFISQSNKRVAETTFNNMHGTLANVGSPEGVAWRSKPNMGALEKVTMLDFVNYLVLLKNCTVQCTNVHVKDFPIQKPV